ncbi:hypothetical protein [Streptomyces sp. NPDC002671]
MADAAYGLWPLVVLTIYLLGSWLGARFPLLKDTHAGGHLWNDLTGWRGDPHLSPFHLASYVAIGGGFWLIATAWKTLRAAAQRDELATTGTDDRGRHPQYDGFLLVMIGFLLQWPTIPTLVMFPVLVYVYARLPVVRSGRSPSTSVPTGKPTRPAPRASSPASARPRRRPARLTILDGAGGSVASLTSLEADVYANSTAPSARSRRSRGSARTAVTGVLAAGLLTLSGSVAFAHGGEGSDRAFDLVRQGIAYLVTKPHDTMDIEDKINDAVNAKDTSHVDLAYVRQAQQAFKSGDLPATRVLLERSIGARVATTPAAPVPIGSPLPITGTETGTLVVADPLPGRGALHAGDWGLLAGSVAVGAGGVAFAIRVRPHDTHGGGTP